MATIQGKDCLRNHGGLRYAGSFLCVQCHAERVKRYGQTAKGKAVRKLAFANYRAKQRAAPADPFD